VRECRGGLEVDDELDFYSLLDGKIGRLLAFKNAPGIKTSLVVAIEEGGAAIALRPPARAN
jgi:hypothetical protein